MAQAGGPDPNTQQTSVSTPHAFGLGASNLNKCNLSLRTSTPANGLVKGSQIWGLTDVIAFDAFGL